MKLNYIFSGFVLLLSLFYNPALSQSKTVSKVVQKPLSSYDWYLPNGSKPKIDSLENRSINQVKKMLGQERLVTYSPPATNDSRIILYKPLTQEAVLVFAADSIHAIQGVKTLNFKKYLHSYRFEDDFAKLSKDELSQPELIEIIGEPDEITDGDYDWIKTLHYNKRDFTIEVRSGKISSFKRYDYTGALANKLGIIDFGINLSDLDDDYVTGFRLTYFNGSTKRIKYISSTVTAYNEVDDVVGKKTAQGIGPIEPNDSGTYSYDQLFFSKIISYIKLTGIKITYFDGSTKTFVPPVINTLFISKD